MQVRIRREIHQWSDQDFDIFARAVQKIKRRSGRRAQDYPNTYDSFTQLHPQCHTADVGPAFLPWHRRFLYDLETSLQTAARNCSLTLPFWNSNLEAGDPWNSIVWGPNRYGGQPKCTATNAADQLVCENQVIVTSGRSCKVDGEPAGWCLVDGLAGGYTDDSNAPRGSCGRCVWRSPVLNPLVNFPRVIAGLQGRSDFANASNFIEMIHNVVHAMLTGGSMGTVTDSPKDPFFYLHHAYIDSLFSWWQWYFTSQGQDTSTCPTCDRDLVYYNDPMSWWIGKYNSNDRCVELPANRPRSCISYSYGITADAPSERKRHTTPRTERQWLALPTHRRCQECLHALEKGSCPYSKLLINIRSTCPLYKQGLHNSCKSFIHSVPDGVMSHAQKQSKLHKCSGAVEAVAYEEAHGRNATAQSAEEGKLCFQCDLLCDKVPPLSG